MLWTAWTHRSLYDVACVDVFSGWAFFWAELVCDFLKTLGKPYILALRGGRLPEFARKQPLVNRLLLNAAKVTTPSLYLKEAFLPIRSDIQHIPNPLEIENYIYANRDKTRPKLCWLRAFHKIYNPGMAIEVLHILKKEYPNVQLNMIGPDKGDGSLRAVRALATQYDLQESLQVVGPVHKSQVPEVLSQNDIFLNTTNYESFGVSVMEAAATGLCIVSTNVGELPYIWTHEKEVMLVPRNEAESMANAVDQILSNPTLASRLSANARLKVEKLSWEIILPKWQELFLSATSNDGR
jgi:glycosyltransferase involved in cell wall biosynthesis